MKLLVLLLYLLFITSGCGSSGSSSDSAAESRAYYLGFTPFPYAISTEAINFSYAEIAANADLVAHHLEEGVPWDELDMDLGLASFPVELREGWQQRKDKSPSGHQSLVSISPIALSRDAIAPRPESVGGGLPGWLTSFTLERTKTAYLRYAVEAVEHFDPDYLVIGIEVNELRYKRPDLWADYLELHVDTYNGLKALYPGLSISVSLTGMNLIEGYRDDAATPADYTAQLTALAEVMPYSDLYCLSMHTFISALLADTVISESQLEEIFSLSSKPLAVCETSYPAETFSIGSTVWNANPAKQAQFFDNLFIKSEAHAAEFVVNFVIRDYDDLWVSLGSPDDFNKLWRDTGFYDSAGSARPALNTWQAQLDLTKD